MHSQKQKRKAHLFKIRMANFKFSVILVLLQSIQLVCAFQWMPLRSTRSNKHLQPPPVLLPTTLGRKPSARQKATIIKRTLPPLKETRLDSGETIIEYQSDDKYDRGEMHISAAVNEGDTLVYRTGSWYVDGVLVGDEDADPAYEYCRVETIQLVWTHNCEHGVLRGLAVDLLEEGDNDEQQGQHLSLRTPLDEVQFGPEQIIARIGNVVWEPYDQDDTGEAKIGKCSVTLHSSMWRDNDAHAIYDE